MIDRDLFAQSSVRSACAALALSAALVVWTLVRAIRIDDTPATTVMSLDASSAMAPPQPAPLVDIGAVVEHDPFDPDRSAPESEYRLPGEDLPSAGVEVVDAAPAPVVLGTAVGSGGRSFATCKLGEDPPLIVREGDRIGQYTVKTIERGRVVFATPAGKRLDVPALKTGM